MNTRNPEESLALLEELVRHQRRTLRYTQLACAFCLLLLLAAGAALYSLYPSAMGVMRHVETSLEGIDVMVSNVNTLVEENSATVTETMEKLNEIDFSQLNDAIGSLSEAAGPLQRISGLFGGL